MTSEKALNYRTGSGSDLDVAKHSNCVLDCPFGRVFRNGQVASCSVVAHIRNQYRLHRRATYLDRIVSLVRNAFTLQPLDRYSFKRFLPKLEPRLLDTQ